MTIGKSIYKKLFTNIQRDRKSVPLLLNLCYEEIIT